MRSLRRACEYAGAKNGSRLDGLGLAGMIVAVIGAIGGNFLFCMFSIIGVILSGIALGQCKKEGKSTNYAIAGTVVGAVGLAVWLAIWIVALATNGVYM
jgi:thiol:disulfide interchange protein